jgi:hypothetical protein
MQRTTEIKVAQRKCEINTKHAHTQKKKKGKKKQGNTAPREGKSRAAEVAITKEDC